MTDFEPILELETVNLGRSGGIARIELNRPEKLNAWNAALTDDLLASLEAVAADESLRSVLLTGAGRSFCSGADLTEVDSAFVTDEGIPDLQRSLRERYHPVILGFRELPRPVVAAVRGAAVGVGLSLALSADLVYASREAYFLLAFVNIGLVPDGGSSAFVPARIGQARATEMAMLGERVGAEKAENWGLINGVFDEDQLAPETEAVAGRLAEGPTRSYAGSKRQTNRWLFGAVEEQLELEAAIQQEMAASADFAEGVSAFVTKRSATFTGR
ncbi:MAG: enoyl-CoA hydratase [Solirubrobacteraceae bacterium]|nr:enoyl-CoA hydratase [Solirubrobacteraceae bacterium]